jgi:hypothetical protein
MQLCWTSFKVGPSGSNPNVGASLGFQLEIFRTLVEIPLQTTFIFNEWMFSLKTFENIYSRVFGEELTRHLNKMNILTWVVCFVYFLWIVPTGPSLFEVFASGFLFAISGGPVWRQDSKSSFVDFRAIRGHN